MTILPHWLMGLAALGVYDLAGTVTVAWAATATYDGSPAPAPGPPTVYLDTQRPWITEYG